MMAYESFALVYDKLMADMPYDRWLSFTREFWQRHSVQPRSVVELGCGTGNITIPLAQSGFHVTGIDLSSSMLAVAQQKREAQNALTKGCLRFIEQDMREWEVGECVEAVISYCDSMNYLTELSDLTDVFRQTWEGLVRGGWFLFDMHSPSTLKTYSTQQPFVNQDEEIAYIWSCDLDEKRCEITHDLSLFIRNETGAYDRVDEWHTQRAYAANVIQEMLVEVGYVDIQHYADFTFERPTMGSKRWFFAAKKP